MFNEVSVDAKLEGALGNRNAFAPVIQQFYKTKINWISEGRNIASRLRTEKKINIIFQKVFFCNIL